MKPGEHLETFQQLVLGYVEAFEQEKCMVGGALYQAPIIRKCWETGSFWYFYARDSPKGLCRVFTEHVQQLFCSQNCEIQLFDQVMTPSWHTNAAQVIERKIEEEERYKDRLREVFGTEAALTKA